jgi:hypothetical protein
MLSILSTRRQRTDRVRLREPRRSKVRSSVSFTRANKGQADQPVETVSGRSIIPMSPTLVECKPTALAIPLLIFSAVSTRTSLRIRSARAAACVCLVAHRDLQPPPANSISRLSQPRGALSTVQLKSLRENDEKQALRNGQRKISSNRSLVPFRLVKLAIGFNFGRHLKNLDYD